MTLHFRTICPQVAPARPISSGGQRGSWDGRRMDRNWKTAGKWNVDQTSINTQCYQGLGPSMRTGPHPAPPGYCALSHTHSGVEELTLWRGGKTRQGGGGVGRRDSGHVAALGAGRSVEMVVVPP